MSIPRPLAPPPVEAPALPKGRFGVGFGPRFLLLAGAGLAWIIPALWDSSFFYAMLAWDGIILFAFFLDWLRLPRPQQLVVRREWHTALSIGVASRLSVSVENRSRADLRVVITDELPSSPWHQINSSSIAVPAGKTNAAGAVYVPGQRGDLTVGRVYLRYRSVFDMAERWALADLQQTVRAYPNFEHARKHAIYLARSRQIELQMRLMRLRGAGSDFESLREYRESDELRNVCWTATARRGKLVARTFQVERSQSMWMVLDCGRLMRTRTEGYSKH